MATVTAAATTTAVEGRKHRRELTRLAGTGPVSFIAMLAGVLVGYASFALLAGIGAAVLVRNGSRTDLTASWESFGTRGAVAVGGLLFLSYLLAGYVAGRAAWRRGLVHGLGVAAGSVVIVGAVGLFVRSVATPDAVAKVSDALRSFGIPTTRAEWGQAGSLVGLASLAAMVAGSVLGGLAGERWYTKVSRRLERAEAEALEARYPPLEEIDIDALSRDELYQRAQAEEIPGRSQMSKDELKSALVEHRF